MRRKITYDPKRDYYAILGIDVTATPEEIRQAYRHCVREVHPDLHPEQAHWATEQLQWVNEAYDILRHASHRREYDRLRWPHIPGRAADSGHRGPFAAPDYDSNRPWWEQVAGHAPRRYPFAGTHASGRSRPDDDVPLLWMGIAAWLRGHRLGVLEPTWLTLIGLWRSPYASLLSILSIILAMNITVIIYMLIAPQDSSRVLDHVQAWFSEKKPATPLPIPTPDQLHRVCDEPGVQIKTPENYERVDSIFSVYGTLQNPGMWNYWVEIGYLGRTVHQDAIPSEWAAVRTPPPNQSIPEPPVLDDLLAKEIDLSGRPIGYYAIRVRVVLRDGSELQPCDVIVCRCEQPDIDTGP
jgi:hypothetical protein